MYTYAVNEFRQDVIDGVPSGHADIHASSDPLRILWHATRPEVKLILLISIGVCLEFSTPQGFGHGRKALAMLVRNIFIPSLVLSKLAPKIDIAELYRCWLIPVVVFGNLFVGMFLGRVLSPYVVGAKAIPRLLLEQRASSGCLSKAKFSDESPTLEESQDIFLDSDGERAKRRLQHIMTLATGIGNYGNLPIVIISSLCDDSTGPIGSLFPSSVECKGAGVAYAALGMAWGQFTMWFFGYIYMLRVIAQERQLADADNKDASSHSISSSSASATSLMDVCKTALFSPPILSSIVAIVIGITPPIRTAIFSPYSPCNVLAEAVETLSGGFIPAVTTLLGCNLASTYRRQRDAGATGASTVPKAVIASVITCRMVVLPALFSLGLFQIFRHFNDNANGGEYWSPLFRVYLLILGTTPGAINLSTVATLLDYGTDESATILFYQYVLAPLPMAVWISLYMTMEIHPA